MSNNKHIRNSSIFIILKFVLFFVWLLQYKDLTVSLIVFLLYIEKNHIKT